MQIEKLVIHVFFVVCRSIGTQLPQAGEIKRYTALYLGLHVYLVFASTITFQPCRSSSVIESKIFAAEQVSGYVSSCPR